MDTMGNVGLVGVQLALVLRLTWRLRQAVSLPKWQRHGQVLLRLACLLLVVEGTYLCWQRSLWSWWQYRKYNTGYAMQLPAFRGWYCYPDLGYGTEQAVAALERLVPQDDTVLILPYGTWIYGLSHRTSLIWAPFIYHDGDLPYIGAKLDEFRDNLRSRPPTWILQHSNQHFWFSTSVGLWRWWGMENWLSHNYETAWQFREWTLLRHTAKPPLPLPVVRHYPQPNAIAPSGRVVADLGLPMVRIEPGSLALPDADGVVGTSASALRVEHEYWLGRYEVTQVEYEQLMLRNPSLFESPRHPVDAVTWEEAMTFCQHLTERERAAGRLPAGLVYRLPTEAEWEYAARGGQVSRGFLYSGANEPDAVAWYGGQGGPCTQMVGCKEPNELGLYDLSGNVFEWCLDDFAGPGAGDQKVIRGGSWANIADNCLLNVRLGAPAGESSRTLGFRLALGPPVP